MLENLENGRKIWTNPGKSKNQDNAKKILKSGKCQKIYKMSIKCQKIQKFLDNADNLEITKIMENARKSKKYWEMLENL